MPKVLPKKLGKQSIPRIYESILIRERATGQVASFAIFLIFLHLYPWLPFSSHASEVVTYFMVFSPEK